MRSEELDFALPAEAIAQRPVEPRDSCRLMYLASDGRLEHRIFQDLDKLLQPGDLLVFNDSRVLPARVGAVKHSGGAVEILFLRPETEDHLIRGHWEALVRPSKRLRVGSELLAAGGERMRIVKEKGGGRWVVAPEEGLYLSDVMQVHGRLPLPPYIVDELEDPDAYQTIYASNPGSAAAPTAGLHFSKQLLERLHRRGVRCAWVTLHVGLDTFLPIREAEVEEHQIHSEWYRVPLETQRSLDDTRARGGRVVAVGTTATRVLETIAQPVSGAITDDDGAISGETRIYITPGYRFLAVDAMITNFHLPRSTVLAMTMAFTGVARLMSAYREAIGHGYRFFSFGDAMLIDCSGAAEPGERVGCA